MLMPGAIISVLPGLFAHCSGALWIPQSKTAIVADLHLGFSYAQRRRGELGPLADSRARDKLFHLCDDLQPREFVFLGDLVHAPRPCAPEREWIEDTLNQLSQRAQLVAVRGNHDRAFAREFAGLNVRTVESWSNESIVAIHGDRLPPTAPANRTLIVGHLHPSLPVKDAAGASRKLPVFLVTAGCIVLPAFSPFAGGYNVASGVPEELLTCFGNGEIATYAVTGTRVAALGPLHRAIASVSQ